MAGKSYMPDGSVTTPEEADGRTEQPKKSAAKKAKDAATNVVNTTRAAIETVHPAGNAGVADTSNTLRLLTGAIKYTAIGVSIGIGFAFGLAGTILALTPDN